MNDRQLMDVLKLQALRPLVLQLICLGFIVLVVWDMISGVRLFSRLQYDVQLYDATLQKKHTTDASSKSNTALKHALFGEYVPKNLDAAAVEQSALNLVVVGVVFATREQDSLVMLRKPDGQEQFLHVGDTVSDGVVIKRITPAGVLVLHEGILERLSLPVDELHFEAPLSLTN